MNEADKILAQQELKELKAQRLTTLRAIADFKRNHMLETFVPHEQQQKLIDIYKSGKCSTHAVLGGNRSGKSCIGAALTVSIAMGRLMWVPLPKPVIIPDPYGFRMNDQGYGIIYRNRDFTTDFPERDQWLFYKPDFDPQSSLNAPQHTPMSIRFFPNEKAWKQWRTNLATPADPGKLRFQPPVKIRIFGEDSKALEQVQIPLIKSLIAPEWIAAVKKNSFGLDGHWVLNNGSTLDFFTYQQEPSSFEGWHGHHLWFDEPPPRPVYVANLRGLVDYQGTSLFTMTPLSQAWLSDEIVNNTSNPKIFSMVMNSYENPHVTKDALDEFSQALTEDEKETRISGKFQHLQGLVFKTFDKQIHVVDPFIPDKQYTVVVAIDTHPRTEQCIIFAAIDRQERVFIFHEIFKHGTPEQVAGWITDFHRNTHNIQFALIDPSSQGDSNRGDSTYDLISRALLAESIPLDFGSKDLSGGIQIMQTYLKSRNGQASLFYTRDCERCLYEITRYVWANWKGSNATSKNELNKPVDLADHTLENVRRILQLPPRWVNPCAPRETGNDGWKPLDSSAGY